MQHPKSTPQIKVAIISLENKVSNYRSGGEDCLKIQTGIDKKTKINQ